MNPHPNTPSSRFRLRKRLNSAAVVALASAGLPFLASAQSTWNGSTSSDWNEAANWSAGVPSGTNAIVNTNSPNIATITATIAATPVDIIVGDGTNNTARVDHRAGDAFTGDDKGLLVGQNGATGVYNLADTSSTGGLLTGFGMGSGNLTVGGNGTAGNLFVGRVGGNGTFNMNSSGTLTVREYFVVGGNAAAGTLNVDEGTLSVGRDLEIGGNSTSGSGTMNMSGGTVTADIVTFGRGNNNVSTVTGSLNLTGGTVNSLRWFTLGFAGNSSDVGSVTNNGGTINVNTQGGGHMEMTVWDTSRAVFTLNSGALNLQNNASMLFGVNGNSGVSAFHQNGGTVTFYADAGTSVGGAGSIVLGNQSGSNPWEISSGTYAYNLNGGTLIVPQIQKTSPNASGSFNFNGGTLKPASSTGVFLEGLTAANIQAGGAIIDTDGYDVTIGQPLLGAGNLTKNGAGVLTLTGTNTYTGTTTIGAGTLALSGNGSLASTVIIPSGLVFDVSGLAVGLQNPVSGVGSINGNVIAAAGMAAFPATDGTAGTLTFNNDLDLSAGGSLNLDLSTSHLGGNDRIVVSGSMTVSSATTIRIKALSGAANLSTGGNYVLSTAAALTVNSTPALAWDGTPPANYLNYSVAQVGNDLVLQYAASTAPTVTATSTPAVVVRNKAVTVSATVTPGSGSVTNVQVDASQIGSSAAAALVLSGTANVYTNTFVIPPTLAPGVKVLTVVAKADTGLNSPGFTVTNTVVATNEVWTGGGLNNLWSTSANWNNAAPALSGDAVTFAGATRTTPDMDNNYSVTGVAFAPGAASFTVSSTGGNTLTLAAGTGVVNNSANPQTLDVQITQSAAQTYDAAAGNLTIKQSLTKSGNLVTVTGVANTVFGGGIFDNGSLFKKGSGSLIITNSSNWDMNQASSAGFSGPLIAQAGSVVFLGNAGSHSVSGELVIGGVITNGGAGNNARIVVDNSTLNVSSWLSIGRGNGVGGVSSDLILTNGASVTAQNASAGYNAGSGLNMPKGSVKLYDTSSLTINDVFHVAEAAGANFDVTLNGSSTLTVGGLMDMAIGYGNTVANMTLNGGTVNCGGDPYIGHWGDGTATLTINNGAFNVGTGTERWLFMGYWDYVNGVININGGQLNLLNNSRIKMARNNNHGGNAFAHVINHNAGDVTFYSDAGTSIGGSGDLDLQYSGGPAGNSTYNLNGGVLTVPTIISTAGTGARTFNFNGGTLKAAVDGVTLMDLNTNAHAYVRANGAIIDTEDKNVTIATGLEHFTGESTDGGLTKKGIGTLILNGTNSYTGNTVVQAGTLQLAQATLASSSTVAISNSAVLQLDFIVTNQVSKLVLNGVSQPAGVYSSSTSPGFITGTGSLLVQPVASNPTNITVAVSGSTLSLSWPSSHLGWVLQQQTNSLSVGLSTNWADVAGSGSMTSTNIAIDKTQPAVFYRLRQP